jgi:hypothetical protein
MDWIQDVLGKCSTTSATPRPFIIFYFILFYLLALAYFSRAALKFKIVILMPHLPWLDEITNVYHYTWPINSFLKKCIFVYLFPLLVTKPIFPSTSANNIEPHLKSCTHAVHSQDFCSLTPWTWSLQWLQHFKHDPWHCLSCQSSLWHFLSLQITPIFIYSTRKLAVIL